MNKAAFTQYDTAEYLKTDEDMAAYFDAVLEENDPQLIVHALNVIARAKGMSQIALDIGLCHESSYQTLPNASNTELSTVLKTIHKLGLQLHASLLSTQA